MRQSLFLALYLLVAARGGARPAAPGRERPSGRLLWLHAGGGATPKSLGQLLTRLVRAEPGISVVVTADCAEPVDERNFPAATIFEPVPEDRRGDIRGFLDHWRPDLFVLAGASLPPAMIVEVHGRGILALLVDVRVPRQRDFLGIFRRSMAAALLSRFARVLAQDPDSARRLAAISGRQLNVEVAGRIEETSDPPRCSETERSALAELLHTRPVWFAVACPEGEEEAVLAAHANVLRLAHRMLLILSPADGARTAALAERCERDGWVVAQRALEQEPDPDVQVFLTEGEAEMGLWYRLAPVTYMGGTLLPGGSGRNPYEPAALGSAIVNGPHFGPYPEAYTQLEDAAATRRVKDAAALAEAVAELIAPDKAALLAHNAWAASSGGAEVTERVMQIILDLMDGKAGPAAAEAS